MRWSGVWCLGLFRVGTEQDNNFTQAAAAADSWAAARLWCGVSAGADIFSIPGISYTSFPKMLCPIAMAPKIEIQFKSFLIWSNLFFFYPPIKYPPLPGVEWSGETDTATGSEARWDWWRQSAVNTRCGGHQPSTASTNTGHYHRHTTWCCQSSDVICSQLVRARFGFDALLIFCFIFQVNQKLYNALRGNRISTKLALKSGFNEKSYKT